MVPTTWQFGIMTQFGWYSANQRPGSGQKKARRHGRCVGGPI